MAKAGKNASRGKVYLIGAGPGDPKLITVRGLEALSKADVVVNDRLANPRLLSHARPDAQIIYVGKSSRDHVLSQDKIIEVIIEHALRGKTVARLKGGDPFVFGRGGEEAVSLAEAGIDFEVIPGVTSAVAVPAYAGIPVTSRTHAASVGIITGHEAPGKAQSDIRWDRIATGLDTLVFLMGVENLPAIVEGLVANGRPADTPVALIRWGTHPSQQTLVGTLADILDKVRAADFKPPAVAVVGDVVRLRDRINWFETRPLFGRRVIVTRAREHASALSVQLEELGAQVDEFPVIKFQPPKDHTELDAAIASLSDFDWIIFTSANGVDYFVRRLMDTLHDIRSMGSARIAAIGPKTAAALKALNLKVDYVPSEYVAEAVVGGFPGDATGKRILIPRASEARDALPDGLASKGAEVVVAPAYETVPDDSCASELRARLAKGGIDIVTFTSASTVRNFLALAGDTPLPEKTLVACIGPITADEARAHGLEPAVVADDYTIEGLVEAIVARTAR